jgi:enoyl-CoA hydratase
LSRALQLIWTGETFGAEQALDWGYVTAVYPAEELMTEVRAFARRLADGPAIAIQAAKRLVYSSLETDEDRALDQAAAMMAVVLGTHDAQEGPRAFQEKRAPRFTGR